MRMGTLVPPWLKHLLRRRLQPISRASRKITPLDKTMYGYFSDIGKSLNQKLDKKPNPSRPTCIRYALIQTKPSSY